LTVPAGDSFERRRVPSAICDYRDYYSNLRDVIVGTRGTGRDLPKYALEVMRIARVGAREQPETLYDFVLRREF